MKVKYTEEVTHEIHLDDDQMDHIAIRTLRERFDIPVGAFIKGKKLMHNVEYNTSHSWDVDEEYRDIDPMDEIVIKVIDHLEEQKYKRTQELAETYFR